MDEATASIDGESDRLIQELLRDKLKGVTVLTIAHRLETVLDSDRILVMDSGRAVEYGSPDSLLQDSSSRFAQLWADHQGHST